MPKTTSTQPNRHLAKERLAFATRVLKGLHKSIDEQIEMARDAEVEQALALLEAGKAKFISHEKMMQEARKRIG
jgi:hypothetical protein